LKRIKILTIKKNKDQNNNKKAIRNQPRFNCEIKKNKNFIKKIEKNKSKE